MGRAAKEAAEEFGKGLRDGLRRGDIDGVLQPINEKVKTTTDLIKDIGGATGIDVSGITNAGNTIIGVLDDVGGRASDAQSSIGDLGGQIDGILKKGEGGKFEQVAGKIGLVTDAVNTLNDIKGMSEDADTWAEEHVPFMKWLNKYTPEKLGQMSRERVDAFMAPLLADIANSPGSPRFGPPGGPPSLPRVPIVGPRGPGSGHGGRAGGGGIYGPGGPKSDRIPTWLSNGEHVFTAADVKAMGGQAVVYAFRSMLHGFAGGGAVDAISFASSVGDGRPYLYGGIGPRYDCSGFMSAIYAHMTGKSAGTRYFSTESNFESLGFVPGSMSGAFNIGIRRGGGGPNSHMAGTLPNGVNVESDGQGTLYGGAAKGASSFPLKYYLPMTGDKGGSYGGGAAGAGGTGGGGGGAGGGGGGGGAGGGGGGGGATGFQSLVGSNPYATLQDISRRRALEGADQKALDEEAKQAISQIFGPKQIGELGDIGVSGLRESLLPPGFADPTQFKSVKSPSRPAEKHRDPVREPASRIHHGWCRRTYHRAGQRDQRFIPEPFGTMPMPQPSHRAIRAGAG
jgi:hypothetical protein